MHGGRARRREGGPALATERRGGCSQRPGLPPAVEGSEAQAAAQGALPAALCPEAGAETEPPGAARRRSGFWRINGLAGRDRRPNGVWPG